MPPRQKKVGSTSKDGKKAGAGVAGAAGGSGGGGIFGALGLGKKKEKKKEDIRPRPGLVDTLGWLWRGGKPIPAKPLKPPSKKDEDDDDDDDDRGKDDFITPSLPAFLVLHLDAPRSGTDFRKVAVKKSHAVFEASVDLTVGELRARIRDFLGEWQDLKLTADMAAKEAAKKTAADAAEAGKAAKAAAGSKPGDKAKDDKDAASKKDKGSKGKGGKEEKETKLVAPEPRQLISGRRAWADSTPLGAVVAVDGAGATSSTGLPWSGHGVELFRYGPVVVVLGSAELDAPVEVIAALPEVPVAGRAGRSSLGSDAGSAHGLGEGVSSSAAHVAAKASRADAVLAAEAAAKAAGGEKRSVVWTDAMGRTYLIPERPAHLSPGGGGGGGGGGRAEVLDMVFEEGVVARAVRISGGRGHSGQEARQRSNQATPDPWDWSSRASASASQHRQVKVTPVLSEGLACTRPLLGLGGSARVDITDKGVLHGVTQAPSCTSCQQ